MSGGSREPESNTDVQCQNCGRYYSSKGIHSHRDSCSHPEWADPLVELEDHSPEASEGGGAPSASTDPDPSDGPDPTTAETDGGLGLPGEPEPSGSLEEEPDPADAEPERDTEECPACGHDLGATEEELRERFGDDPFGCGECGERLGVDA